MRASFLLVLGLAALPVSALAHPHVFVDTKLRILVSDAGVFEGIEVSWTYDDFYSLLLFADLGLDNDGDGALDQTELVRLDGFDLQWIDGFEGDSYAYSGDTRISLGAPQGRGVSVADGKITTTHFRPVTDPTAAVADGLQIKAYDPTFYTAYSLVDAAVQGPCQASIAPADLDAAYTLVEELLYATPAADAEADYPQVGEAFADTVSVTCDT